jgi:hypothetical protein
LYPNYSIETTIHCTLDYQIRNAAPTTAATTTTSHVSILDFVETAPLVCLYAGEDVPAAAVEVLETFAGVVLTFKELEDVTVLGDDEVEETEAALTAGAGAGVVVDLMLDDVDFLEELTGFTLDEEDLPGEAAGLIFEVVVECFDEDDVGLGLEVVVGCFEEEDGLTLNDECVEDEECFDVEEDGGLALDEEWLVVDEWADDDVCVEDEECFDVEEEDGLRLEEEWLVVDEWAEDDVCVEEDDGLTVEEEDGLRLEEEWLVVDEWAEDDVCVEEDDGLTVELVESECDEDEECVDEDDECVEDETWVVDEDELCGQRALVFTYQYSTSTKKRDDELSPWSNCGEISLYSTSRYFFSPPPSRGRLRLSSTWLGTEEDHEKAATKRAA